MPEVKTFTFPREQRVSVSAMEIHDAIQAYYGGMTGPHHRYRSWEHCFRYFHRSTPDAIAEDRDHAALQLGFYLDS
jgi:hypothetical protein